MKHFIRLSSRTSSYQRMAHVFNYRLQRLALAAVTYTIELAAYGFQLLLAAGPVQQLMKQFCLIQKQELPLPLAQRGLQRSGTGQAPVFLFLLSLQHIPILLNSLWRF